MCVIVTLSLLKIVNAENVHNDNNNYYNSL